MLNYLYGSQPTTRGLIFIHLAALVTGIFAILMQQHYGVPLSALGQLVLFSLALDVGGGAVANITLSTNNWYIQQPIYVSYLFLIVHLAQPFLMVSVVGLAWETGLFLYLYQLAAGALVLRQRGRAEQPALAAFLLVLGLLIYLYGFAAQISLLWFGVLYLTKLVLMFSVDHYAAGRSQAS